MSGSGMNCLIGSPFDNSVESKSTQVEYWYGVEASVDDATTFQYDLESLIYHKAIENVQWCTGCPGCRRVEEVGETPYYLDELGRRLGIMAISSAPMDKVELDVTCPQTLENENINCFTIQGMITIMSRSENDVSMAADYLRQEIKSAMETNVFMSGGRGESGLASITGVTYLGNSLDEVLSYDDGETKNDKEVADEEVATADVEEEEYVPPTVSEGIKNVAAIQNRDQGNEHMASIAIGSVVGAACIMLLGILLVKRRKHRRQSQMEKAVVPLEDMEDDDDTFGGATIISQEEEEDFENSMGIAPPDETELRAQALAAEREYAMEKGLGTIPEDETYYSDMRSLELVSADASHLGTCHSSIDVQPCQSPNCKQCRDYGVVFIPRDWQPDMSSSDEGGDDSSDNAIA